MASATHTPEALPGRLAPRVGRVEVVVAPTAPPKRVRPSAAAAAGLLIVAWAGLNLAYVGFDCPLDLSPDEAHYWHWSRHLDWSYYSKGPLVGWLIRASCEAFGNTAFAVRFPAVLSSAILLAGLYRLAGDAFRSPRAGLTTVALAMTLPPVTAGAVVMTIDPPFLACWCWALVAVMRAVERPGGWWLLAGACSAVGVLAKFTMLLFPVAVAGFLLARRPAEFRRPGVWLMLGLTAVGCLPVVLWNAAHDWVSVRHVFGQAGGPGGVRWFGPAEFAAGQLGLLLGFWFAAFGAASRQYRASPDPRLALLWWASVPVWLVFLSASLRTPGQVNWPAAAYVGGLVLAFGWVRHRLNRRAVRLGLAVAVAAGLGSSTLLRYPGLPRPTLALLAGPSAPADATPIRKLDPTARLRGWRTLASEVDTIRERVRTDMGHDPVLAGMRWTVPGELSFYCRGHPEAYSFGPALADRHSQYDLWRPNPVADAQAFRGRSFVYVGDEIPNANALFDRVEPPVRVVYAEGGVPVATWTVWVGHGFRGFPERRADAGY